MAESSLMWRGAGFQQENLEKHIQMIASTNQMRLLERLSTLIAKSSGWHMVSNAIFITSKMLLGDTPLFKKYCQLK